MKYSDFVASYRNGLNKVVLYYDRIELGVLSLSSYRYEEIKYAKFINIFIGTYLILTLKNGKKPRKKPTVMMFNSQAKICRPILEKFISNSQKSSGNPEGVYLRCTVLGGSGTALVAGEDCLAHFKNDTVTIATNDQRINITLNQLSALTLNNPVAVMPNILDSSAEKNTTLHVAWPGAELFLHTTMYAPGKVRMLLSHAFIIVESIKNKDIEEL